MNQSGRASDDTRIPDDVADEILAKAAELDGQTERAELTIGQLRDSALEAGISREAFDSALDIVLSAGSRPVSSGATRMARLRGVLVWSGGVGGTIGLCSGALMRALSTSEAFFLLAWLVGVISSLDLAMRHRTGARVRWFALGVVCLWIYLFAGMTVGAGVPISALERIGTLIAATIGGCILAGAAIIHAPDDSGGSSPDPDPVVDESLPR